MRWFENPNYDFIGYRRIALIISAVLMIVSIVGLFTVGLKYGIEFKGGKGYVVKFEQPVGVTAIRDQLTDPLNGEPLVKKFGNARRILIRTDAKGSMSDVQATIMASLQELYPQNPSKVIRSNVVGPRFAQDMRSRALKAVFIAVIVIFIYILIRFKNWRMSLGASIALAHDVIIVAGIFAFFKGISPFSMQVDETIIAAFLTIIGFSINDTVVIFDRAREYLRKRTTMDYLEVVNTSLNDTLSRTVVTALTVFFVVFILFFFGGQTLKGFSFAMMLGVFLGCYSSLFIATGIAVELHLWKPEKNSKKKDTKRKRRSRRRAKQTN